MPNAQLHKDPANSNNFSHAGKQISNFELEAFMEERCWLNAAETHAGLDNSTASDYSAVFDQLPAEKIGETLDILEKIYIAWSKEHLSLLMSHEENKNEDSLRS